MFKNIRNDAVESLLKEGRQNFLTEEDADSLRVLIRIADEFNTFLREVDLENYPSFEVSDYVISTIRSGFDCYFELFFASKNLNFRLSMDIDYKSFVDFKKFKVSYLDQFEKISSDFQHSYLYVLALWKMHFIFIGFVI